MSVETVRNIRRYQKAEFRVNQNPDVHLALGFEIGLRVRNQSGQAFVR